MLFLLFAVFSSFFTIPVEIENARLKLVLVILTGAPMTNSNDAIEMKQKKSKEAKDLLRLLLISSLSLISATE